MADNACYERFSLHVCQSSGCIIGVQGEKKRIETTVGLAPTAGAGRKVSRSIPGQKKNHSTMITNIWSRPRFPPFPSRVKCTCLMWRTKVAQNKQGCR